MATPKFGVGSAVFVKMRGYPAWPAKVEGIADETPSKVKYHIFFYGTKQIAVCKEDEMKCYLTHRESLGKPKKYKGFNEGILEMDKELGLEPNTSNTERLEQSNNSEMKTPQDRLKEKDKVTDPEKADLSDQISVLQLQANLNYIHFRIQNCLGLREADPEACLVCLSELSNLNPNELILKKHPEIVYTLEKLQKYVGNTDNWNMTENEIKVFQSKAQKIRDESKRIYKNFQALFPISDRAFLDYFDAEVVAFQKATQSLSLEEICCLTEDPTKQCESV